MNRETELRVRLSYRRHRRDWPKDSELFVMGMVSRDVFEKSSMEIDMLTFAQLVSVCMEEEDELDVVHPQPVWEGAPS